MTLTADFPDFSSQHLPDRWANPLALLTSQQVRVADALAAQQGIDTDVLMGRAGAAVATEVKKRFSRRPVVVLCGPGNNVGDGLVAAAELKLAGWQVTVALLRERKMMKRWDGECVPLTPSCLEGAGLVIDALLGVGLDRALGTDFADLFMEIESRGLPVVAVDIPSGIEGNTGRVSGTALKAAVTVTFARKKPGHLLLPGRSYAGEVVVADIGLPASIYDRIQPNLFENGPDLWRSEFPVPAPDAHKYSRGVTLVAWGGEMTGAARLAARAAQRAGAGLVYVAAPEKAVPIYAASLESCIIRTENWPSLVSEDKHDALLIGPGYGVSAQTKRDVLKALAGGRPCVLDSDALTSFSAKPFDLVENLPADTVLTPHEGEFARLFPYQGDVLRRASLASVQTGTIMVLKGPSTVIAAPDGTCILNSNAPPTLATAGSGDVLAGLITGLLAQGMAAFPAAAAAVWLHGEVARRFGPGLIAEDISAGLPEVLRGILGNPV